MDIKAKTQRSLEKIPWLRWFIMPRKMPDTPLEQQQAKQLTFYLFIVALATILNFFIWLLTGHLPTFTIISLIAGVTLYSLARVLYYKTVAFITILSTLIMPFILFWLNPPDFPIIAALFCLTLALLLSSQFFSLKANLQIAILVFLTTFYFNENSNVYGSISVMSLFFPLLIIIFISLLNAYGRERLLELVQEESETSSLATDFLQSAIDIMHIPALIQVEQTIIAVNDATVRLVGVNAEEIIGQLASDYISTEDSTNYKVDNQAGKLTISYDDSFPSKQGKILARITASSITYKDAIATLITIQPHEVPEKIQMLEKIMESSLSGVMVTDADLDYGPYILMVNPRLCEMTGYTERELIGQTPHIFQGKATEQDLIEKIEDALRNGAEDFETEFLNYRKDGSIFRVLMNMQPLRNTEGNITHYILNQLEIKQQSQLQADVAECKENQNIISKTMTGYTYIFKIAEQDSLDFSWMAGAVEDITGLSIEEAMFLNDWRHIVHEDDQAFYDVHISSLLKGQTSTVEYRIWNKDGTIRWIQDKAHPILDKNTGEVNRILGSAHDITERTNSQEILKTYVVQQAVIAELGLVALNTDDLETLLNHVTVLCEQVLQVGLISVFKHHPEDNSLSYLRISNDNNLISEGKIFSDDYTQSLAGYTLQSSDSVISDNIFTEKRFSPLEDILKANYKSAAGVMILGGEIPFGVLAAYNNQEAFFTFDEVYFLQSIANIVGTFIARSHAQLAERQQTEFAEALRDATSVINSRLELPEVLDKMINYVRQVVPQTKQATIMLLNEETQSYHFHTTWGFSEDTPEILDKFTFVADEYPILKVMLDTSAPIYIVDIAQDSRWVSSHSTNKTQSYLGAPIIFDNETIGFINLHGFEVGAFDDEDAQRLKTFADKTSTAIINARKQEDLERKVLQRTQELQQEQEQFKAIFLGTGDGIFYTEQNRIAFINDAFSEMTGFSPDDLMGQSSKILQPSDITPLELEKFNSIAQSIRNNEIWRDTVRIRRQDNSAFEAGLTISRVISSDSDVLRSVTIVRDMSRERELEDLKRTFIAAAAHDLRSPISSLKMRMYMIKKQPENIDHHLERVSEIIDHVNHLVNDLLDAHGRIVLRMQNIILQEVLDTVVDNLSLEAEQKNMLYTYNQSKLPAPILADEHRLTQVFTNLISNAIHYTKAEGSITITTKLNHIEKSVRIDIQDTGRGIPFEEQENIFLPFYRAKGNESKGNGLGLSITREIIELHNGSITVESVVGEGSTFTVILPLIELP